MVIIPQTLHRCRNIQRYISSILAIRPVILSRAKCAVRWQTIYTTFKHVAWVAARQLTELKTLWPYAANITKCMATANNGKIGYKRCMI